MYHIPCYVHPSVHTGTVRHRFMLSYLSCFMPEYGFAYTVYPVRGIFRGRYCMQFIKILMIIVAGSTKQKDILTAIPFLAGAWKVLVKCGLPGYQALIPCYNIYALSACADRKSDGRVLFISYITLRVLAIAQLLMPVGTNTVLLLSGFIIALGIITFIYYCRLMVGFAELFGLRKVWVLPAAVFEYVVFPLWGFSKKFVPAWTVSDTEKIADTFFSGSHVDAMAQGLTINLEERSVSEMFSKKHLLRDIHMYIKPGSMVLLLGGSGAGKTTLLNAINGYEKAKAEITLNGRDVYKNYEEMQYEVGFVPQQDLMRLDDTVYHTLLDSAALRLPRNFSKDDREKRVADVMDIFGLTPVKDSLAGKLSGGQRKRLSIAMEFISNPSLFILDEPDSGLDGVMARELMQQLRRIADQGKIVIVITHTPDRVIDLFDDVTVLAKDVNRTGRLAWYGSIGDAKSFFGKETMEEIVKTINRKEEGGEGRADEFIKKYSEVQHG